MINLCLFILLVYGLTYIITESYIFNRLREKVTNKWLSKLVNCPTCSSFWIGLCVSFIIPLTFFCVFDAIIALAAINIIQKVISF